MRSVSGLIVSPVHQASVCIHRAEGSHLSTFFFFLVKKGKSQRPLSFSPSTVGTTGLGFLSLVKPPWSQCLHLGIRVTVLRPWWRPGCWPLLSWAHTSNPQACLHPAHPSHAANTTRPRPADMLKRGIVGFWRLVQNGPAPRLVAESKSLHVEPQERVRNRNLS